MKICEWLEARGIHCKDSRLIEQAFVHSSYVNEHKQLKHDNERLEFMGDAVLQLWVSDKLFRLDPPLDEGHMTTFRAQLVCEEALAIYARQLQLNAFLKLGVGEEKTGGRERDSIIADMFEAMLGALYEDSGMAPIDNILTEVITPHLSHPEEPIIVDHKTKLQEYVQSDSRKTVTYEVINTTGPSNKPEFEVQVKLEGIILGTGKGNSKKKAEQKAAQNAFEKDGALIMKQGNFGTLQDGRSAQWLEIENEKLRVRVSDYGATLVSLWVKDAQLDAVLGFDDVSGYQQSVKYMGAMIGRVANRIKDGQFTLNGQVYSLYRNDKGNTLHGGQEGFDAKLWTVREHTANAVTLTLISPDGEEGFPGELTVAVTYALTGSRLSITTTAESTAATPVSLTNHAYFTLSGQTPSLDEHWIQVDADEIGLLDPNGCTRPETLEVDGTVFDLRQPKRLSDVLKQRHSQLELAGGLDHNYVLNGVGFRQVARLIKDKLTMRVLTDMPDMHVYTANFLTSGCGRGQATYTPHCAVCFETQYYPNSVNDPSKISCILEPGETMEHCTAFEFNQEDQA